jgi:hypothetical protein
MFFAVRQGMAIYFLRLIFFIAWVAAVIWLAWRLEAVRPLML